MFDLNVRGYSYAGVTFWVTDSIPPKVLKAIRKGGPVSGLHLRDYALDGGEVHMLLSAENRQDSDPGYWYAAKCERWPEDRQTRKRIGTILLRQMGADDQLIQTRELALEDLDNGHLLDRLTSETLRMHADTFGTGPLGEPTAVLKKRRPRP